MIKSSKKTRKVAKDKRRCLLDGHKFDAQIDRPNIVRIFLSSTFFDFLQERNYLFNEALPELDSWCQERGLEFQVVDMRWGVRDNVAMDLGGVNMCLKEIDHCHKLSIGPSFVTFIGDRYGRRLLPTSIPATDFDVILQEIENSQDRKELSSWYQVDENALPPVYFLKPVTKAFKNYHNPENASIRDKERTEWYKLQEKLQNILTIAVKKAANSSKIEKPYRYIASVTEQEIWKGIIDHSEPEFHTLCFVRNLKNLKVDPNYIQKTKKYADFTDPETKGELDPTATEMLRDLKRFLLPSKLDDTNLFRFNVNFDPTCGINPKLTAHQEYLKELCSTFVKNIKELIIEGLKHASSASQSDPLYKEVALHANFAVHKAQLYCGRDTILRKMYKKLTDLQSTQPMVLYGESGVGKTATIAKLIIETWKNVPGLPNVVYRFLGTTPESSSLELLLLSLAKQVAELYHLEQPSGYNEEFSLLKPFFFEMLGKITDPPLVIILDSLDQLSPSHGAHLMNWLPDVLPPLVKILVTVMPNFENILDRLQARLKPTNQIELTQLSNKTAATALARLLAQSGRALQSEQMKLVDQVFGKSQNPLLLHLTLVEVSKWRSYTPQSELRLGSTPYDAIEVLFDRLEASHGKVLVSHALAYLVAAMNGLTEREMEEILSIDNEVLNDVYQYWAPPSETEIRVPPMVWARLKQEMGDFVVNRQRDGMTVLGMYHKQFIEVINKRYLSSDAQKQKLHGNLVEFFEGTWFSAPKPIKLKIFSYQNKTLWRKVPSQPLQYVKGRYNLRKLNELPRHLLLSGNTKSLKENILTNFEWLNAKIRACDISALLSDFDSYLEFESDKAIFSLKQCLRLAKPTLEYPGNEDKLATELLGRLHSIAKEDRCIKKLLEQAREWCEKSSEMDGLLLLPENLAFPSPDGALITTLNSSETDGIMCAHSTETLNMTGTVEKGGTLRIWDMKNDTIVHAIQLEGLAENIHVSEEMQRIILWGSTAGLCIYDLKAGNLLHRLEQTEFDKFRQERKFSNGLRLTQEKIEKTFFLITKDQKAILTKNNHLFIVDMEGDPKISKRFDLDKMFDFIRYEYGVLLGGVGKKKLLKYDISSMDFDEQNFGNVKLIGANFVLWDKSSSPTLTAIGFEDGRTIAFAVEEKNKKKSKTGSELPDLLESKRSSSGKKRRKSKSSPEQRTINLLQAQPILSDLAFDAITVASRDFLAILCPVDYGEIVKVQRVHHQIYSLKLASVKSRTLTIVGSADASLRIFNCLNLELVGFFSGLWAGPTQLSISGNYLLSASCNAPFVKVWNMEKFSDTVENDTTVESLYAKPSFWMENNRSIVCRVGSDGRTVNVANENQKVIHSVSTQNTIQVLFVLVQADKLIYGNNLGHIRVYTVGKHDELLTKVANPIYKYSFLPEKKLIVIVLENQELFSIPTDSLQIKQMQTFVGLDGKIQDICITSYGLVLFCYERAFLQTTTGRLRHKLQYQGTLMCYCTREDTLVICSKEKERNHQLSVFNLDKQRIMYTVVINDGTEVTCLELSPCLRFLLVGFGKGAGPKDAQRQIRIYDFESREILRQKVFLYLPLVAITFFDRNQLGVIFEAGHFGKFLLIEPKIPRISAKNDKKRRSTIVSPQSTACTII